MLFLFFLNHKYFKFEFIYLQLLQELIYLFKKKYVHFWGKFSVGIKKKAIKICTGIFPLCFIYFFKKNLDRNTTCRKNFDTWRMSHAYMHIGNWIRAIADAIAFMWRCINTPAPLMQPPPPTIQYVTGLFADWERIIRTCRLKFICFVHGERTVFAWFY